jgi:hypothetical protein
MSFTISADDPRTIRAIEIAAEADQWLTGHNQAGEAVFGVPSQAEPGRYYIVTRSSCECADFKQHPDSACKHMLAVRLHTELVRAHQQLPRRREKRQQPGGRQHLSVVS